MCARKSFYILVLLSTTNNEIGHNYLKSNRINLYNIYKQLPNECRVEIIDNFQKDFADEKRLKLMKEKMKKFKRNLYQNNDKTLYENDKFFTNFRKKNRKRTKSSRSTQLKSNFSIVENIKEPTIENSRISSKIEENVNKERNPICTGLLEFLEKQEENLQTISNPSFPQWKLHILNLPFEENTTMCKILKIDTEKVKKACLCLKELSTNKKTPPRNINIVVNVVITYLTTIFNYIVNKYENYWKMDKMFCYYNEFVCCSQNTRKLERHVLTSLRENFNILIESIKSLQYKDISICYVNVCQLEEKLLLHEIRGRSIISEIFCGKTVHFKHTPILIIDENSDYFLNYVQDVLNDRIEPRDEVINIQIYENSVNRCMDFDSLSKPIKIEPLNSIQSKIIDDLKNEELYEFLSGDIKLCSDLNKINKYLISPIYGNFNQTYIGLNKINEPLAVKRISEDLPISKVLSSLVRPLLGIRHINILPYIECNFNKNELFLATQLSELNIGQYVMKMNETTELSLFTLTAISAIKQVLSGLRFLHELTQPIIHGNLKPSNVFVDLNGTVRLAEFGIHQVKHFLFKL